MRLTRPIPIAPLLQSSSPDLAAAFVAFIRTGASADMLEARGFIRP